MPMRRLWRFAAVYGFVFVVNAAALEMLVGLKLDPALAQALLLAPCVAFSYLLNRAFVFGAVSREAST